MSEREIQRESGAWKETDKQKAKKIKLKRQIENEELDQEKTQGLKRVSSLGLQFFL